MAVAGQKQIVLYHADTAEFWRAAVSRRLPTCSSSAATGLLLAGGGSAAAASPRCRREHGQAALRSRRRVGRRSWPPTSRPTNSRRPGRTREKIVRVFRPPTAASSTRSGSTPTGSTPSSSAPTGCSWPRPIAAAACSSGRPRPPANSRTWREQGAGHRCELARRLQRPGQRQRGCTIKLWGMDGPAPAALDATERADSPGSSLPTTAGWSPWPRPLGEIGPTQQLRTLEPIKLARDAVVFGHDGAARGRRLVGRGSRVHCGRRQPAATLKANPARSQAPPRGLSTSMRRTGGADARKRHILICSSSPRVV